MRVSHMIKHLSGKYVTDLSLGDAEAENNRKILALSSLKLFVIRLTSIFPFFCIELEVDPIESKNRTAPPQAVRLVTWSAAVYSCLQGSHLGGL